MMKDIPSKIYLQVGDLTDGEMRELPFDELDEVTWWKERIFKTDIEYVLPSSLPVGTYRIPEGCKVNVKNGTFQISARKDNRIKEGDWRCRDCKHRIEGKATINAWKMSCVCELKPKQVRNPRFANQKLFYCANRNDKACENFERKEVRK